MAAEWAPDRVAHEAQSNPLGRLVDLNEVAQVVHFLCSPASDAIIAQTLVIDGGKAISAPPPQDTFCRTHET